MDGRVKLEGYFNTLNLHHKKTDDDTWIVHDPEQGVEQVFVSLVEDLVTVRVAVLTLPASPSVDLLKSILKLNSAGLVHVAYALEGDQLILTTSFLIDTLDLEELQSAFDDMGVALSQHYPVLSRYLNK